MTESTTEDNSKRFQLYVNDNHIGSFDDLAELHTALQDNAGDENGPSWTWEVKDAEGIYNAWDETGGFMFDAQAGRLDEFEFGLRVFWNKSK